MTIATGEKMLASDILDLTFFPIGSILMMDGSWTDGRGGWYVCDGRDTPHGKTPNLRDKFIKGSGNKPANGNGQMILGAQHLPAHKHSITDPGHAHMYIHEPEGTGGLKHGSTNWVTGPMQEWTTPSTTGITETNYNAGGGQAFDVLPSYYSVIYIKKMA
ncbi:MAG: hypothetical protein LBL50_01170 [Candidatus Margulisbacteria bacterium]|jgi:hypothetical protein|nr:hypothetical protein [Candidatus Margulisiibacteriota bacterium]